LRRNLNLLAAKILHIILAITVFFSSTGFTLHKHICKEEAKDMSCMDEQVSCDKAMPDLSSAESTSCNPHQCDENGDCCENIAKYYQLDEEKQAQSANFELLKKPALVYAILVVFNYPFAPSAALKASHLTYKPPIVQEDILVMLQTFLC
jgi:hypothetical protein